MGLNLEDELQCVLDLPAATLARELRLSERCCIQCATLDGHTRGRSISAVRARGIHRISPGVFRRVTHLSASWSGEGITRAHIVPEVLTIEPELRVIEHVEHFQAELQLCPLSHLPVLHDGEVHVVYRRTRASSGAGVAEGAQFVAVPGKRFGIQPLVPGRIAEMAWLTIVAQGPTREGPARTRAR